MDLRPAPPASVGRGLRVRTSSDNQNVWMHAINRELGFVPVESEVVLQKRRVEDV